MAVTKIVGLVVEHDGKQSVARPVSPEALAAAAAQILDKGRSLDSCECGDEMCISGYVWRCAYGPSGDCEWFESDVGCN
jgi:hypothetical protein